MKRIFITGIGTDVGKSIASAIIVEALEADYWKPVQSGSLEGTDTQTLIKLISNNKTQFHKETYCYPEAVSPHLAAELVGENIDFNQIITPISDNTHLCIEGAGGLFVPLNDEKFVVDLINQDDYVILVSRHYVGSINHTLLSINELENRGLNFAVLFVGDENPSTEKIIRNRAKVLGRIPVIHPINPESIYKNSKRLISKLLVFLAD